MRVTVNKSEVKGKATTPSSKSMTIRALMCAALSRGTSDILHPLVSDDTNAAADVLGKVGVEIHKENDKWSITSSSLHIPEGPLHCGESATTMRFMIGICALIPGKHRLIGGSSLSKRPVKSLMEALKKLGVKGTIEGKTNPPVEVEGGTFKGGITEIPGNISSQFISALLLVSPLAKEEVSIRLTTPLTSKPYILMTLWCLKQFGIEIQRKMDRFVIQRQRYQPCTFEVEGDWSSASYLLALGTKSQGVTIDNLSASSLQGDRVVVDYLRGMGARVAASGRSVTVSQGRQENLRAVHADLSDCIDLLPTMAILAAQAKGKSEFIGIERARIKESNRVTAIKEGLLKLGIPVTEEKDRLTITGLMTPKAASEDDDEKSQKKDAAAKAAEDAKERKPVVIDSYGDHRIAMAFGVLGAAIGGIIIDGAECVAKTYPDFWETLKSFGVDVRTNG